ncbi:hypothetical protein OROGR_012186 [Orobanche gracilis]
MGSDRNLKYTLYGVLVHAVRSTQPGHYCRFVRTSSGMWYSLDDNLVVGIALSVLSRSETNRSPAFASSAIPCKSCLTKNRGLL